MTSEEALKTKILGRLDLSREVEDEELQELIFCVLEEESAVEYIPLEEKARLGKELFNGCFICFRRTRDTKVNATDILL